MKLFSVLFMSLWMSSAFAQQQSNYEIEVSEKDYRIEGQRMVDHSEYRLKRIKCNGKDYGVAYESYWGWSTGSKFVGVCEWKFRNSVDACNNDNQPSTIECYNKAIDYFNLDQTKYPKIRFNDSGRPSLPRTDDVPDLDAPLGSR